jgi:hypothetical protein
MGFTDSKAAVMTILSGIAGITNVYAAPPINVSPEMFPFFIGYPFEGEMTAVSHGFTKGLHKMVAELHQSSKVVPQALVAVEVWPERMLAALAADTTLAALNTHVVWPLVYKAGPLEYGKNVHYGMRFEITLKVH